jgi:GTP cyclohydrolase II
VPVTDAPVTDAPVTDVRGTVSRQLRWGVKRRAARSWFNGNSLELSTTTRYGRSLLESSSSREETSMIQSAAAGIRTTVRVPLRFPDGYATEADVYTFTGLADGKEHLALALGDYAAAKGTAAKGTAANGTAANGTAANGTAANGTAANGTANGTTDTVPLVRAHSECLTGDVFGSQRCDCGPQLREAAERIAKVGGYLLYLRQEGRGIGLYAKLDAYALQDAGLDTYEANRALGHGDDERDYTAAAQMLTALGAGTVDLLTNNPDKPAQLRRLGVNVRSVQPTGVHLSAANVRYLQAKVTRTAHTLALPVAPSVSLPLAG